MLIIHGTEMLLPLAFNWFGCKNGVAPQWCFGGTLLKNASAVRFSGKPIGQTLCSQGCLTDRIVTESLTITDYY